MIFDIRFYFKILINVLKMKQKRSSLTILQKVEILEKIQKGQKAKLLCEEYSVNKTVISRIKKIKKTSKVSLQKVPERKKTKD